MLFYKSSSFNTNVLVSILHRIFNYMQIILRAEPDSYQKNVLFHGPKFLCRNMFVAEDIKYFCLTVESPLFTDLLQSA